MDEQWMTNKHNTGKPVLTMEDNNKYWYGVGARAMGEYITELVEYGSDCVSAREVVEAIEGFYGDLEL